MKIEFVVARDEGYANHMVWTIPDEEYDPHWFPVISKAINDLIDSIHSEPETNGDYPCDQCDRTFPTKQGLSMHKTRAHEKRF